jgi:hypothetical protein
MKKRQLMVMKVLGVVFLWSLCAQGAITWEAHWNNGSKSPDTYTGGMGPWGAPQNTTPLITTGGRGGSGAVDSGTASTENLNYPSNSNVNLDHGTMSVWFKPKFSWNVDTSYEGVIVNVANGTAASGTLIKLHYNPNTDRFTWRSRAGSGSWGNCTSQVQNFNAGDWIHITLAWDTGYSATQTEAKMYVNGVLADTEHYDHRTPGYFSPWAICVGNAMGSKVPYGGQANGVIDDLVFSNVYNDAVLVPEPATVMMLGVGLISFLRRRG